MQLQKGRLSTLLVTFTLGTPLLAADHVTVKLFSGNNCDGNLIETAVLGMASLGVCKNADQAYHSIQTTNIGQSFFGKGIKLVAFSGRCAGGGQQTELIADLSNNPAKNCHKVDGESFMLLPGVTTATSATTITSLTTFA